MREIKTAILLFAVLATLVITAPERVEELTFDIGPVDDANKEPEEDIKLYSPGELKGLVIKYSRRYNVPEDILLRMAKTESEWNPSAVSPKGAAGIMQLMPETAKALGVTDLHCPEQNIKGGVKYFAEMLRQFDGNLTLAVAAYNAGPGAVRKYGGVPPYPETEKYVQKVLGG